VQHEATRPHRQQVRLRGTTYAGARGQSGSAHTKAGFAGYSRRAGRACTPSTRKGRCCARHTRATTRTRQTPRREEGGSGRTWRTRRAHVLRPSARWRGARYLLEERLERRKEDPPGRGAGPVGDLQESPPGVGPLTFLALRIPADAWGGSLDSTQAEVAGGPRLAWCQTRP
jgi:hypothetical protein